MFSGSIPALATPFRDGSFDESAFRKLVDWQIENGSKALVPCGTYAEIGGVVQGWYGGIADTITFPVPDSTAEDDAVRAVLAEIRAGA